MVELKRLFDPDIAGQPASAAVARGRIPVWVASWGSAAGMRRVARLGWVASVPNTTPEQFRVGRERLRDQLDGEQSAGDGEFPHALVTMWLWITDDDRDADRVLDEVLGPMLRRDPTELRDRVCVGSVERCADLLGRYAASGCRRLHVWPLGDEPAQLERVMRDVLPRAMASVPTEPPPPAAGRREP